MMIMSYYTPDIAIRTASSNTFPPQNNTPLICFHHDSYFAIAYQLSTVSAGATAPPYTTDGSFINVHLCRRTVGTEDSMEVSPD
jgi:hypothetical protein